MYWRRSSRRPPPRRCSAPAQPSKRTGPRSRQPSKSTTAPKAACCPPTRTQGRRYVVGKPGNEYAIRVRNQSGGRVLAVMSVDGVNAISGDTASPAQTGYVLSPYESADIAGWRKSMSHTAAFYFTPLPDSYAARTGRPGQCRRDRRRGVPRAARVRWRSSSSNAAKHARDAAEPAAKAAQARRRRGALASDAGSRAAAESRHRSWPQRIVVRELHANSSARALRPSRRSRSTTIRTRICWRRACRSAFRASRAGSPIHFPTAADSRRTRAEFSSTSGSRAGRGPGTPPHPAARRVSRGSPAGASLLHA